MDAHQRYFGDANHGLLELQNERGHFLPIWGDLTALVIDNFFVAPEQLREAAGKLDFRPAPGTYPGRLANVPRGDPELTRFCDRAMHIVREAYLPNMGVDLGDPPAISQVRSDFAVVDVHPDELSEDQRVPHRDPVPIFGLIYLSLPSRGGTLFFEEFPSGEDVGPHAGYFCEETAKWRLCGKVDGIFNRAVFYPGSIPHTGEIAGDWIRSEERFTLPRLTLRLLFR